MAAKTGYTTVASFRVPSNYPVGCSNWLICLLTGRKPVSAKITISVSGSPVQQATSTLANVLEVKPSTFMDWGGKLMMPLQAGQTSVSITTGANNPAMTANSNYNLQLLTTGNGWRDLRVVTYLEYNNPR